ncbi:hypothetical protein BH23GEM11_BH23GEM11_16890 [soil metagenome]
MSAAVILVLTLTPNPGARETTSALCVICGAFGTANLIRNVILFVPLGLGAGIVVGMGTRMGPGPEMRPGLGMRTGAGAGPGAAAGTAAEGRTHRGPVNRFLQAWLPAVGLTAGIEVTQIFLPGRNPLVVDFAANAAGAALGILLVGSFVRGAAWTSPAGGAAHRRSAMRTLGWWGLSAVALVGTALAFRLAPPPPPHFVQIQADLAQFERYAGEVRGVWLEDGDDALPGEQPARDRLEIGRYPHPRELESRVLGGSRVRVAFEAGPPPTRIAPLFSVYTEARREVILLGVQGEDAVLRLPYLAATLRLDRPDHRVPGALRGMQPGEEGELVYWRSDGGAEGPGGDGGHGSACLQLTRGPGPESVTAVTEGRAAGTCGLRPTLGQGWTLLLYPARFPPWLKSGMSWAWLLGLGFVPGLFSRSRRVALLAGVALLLVGVPAP